MSTCASQMRQRRKHCHESDKGEALILYADNVWAATNADPTSSAPLNPSLRAMSMASLVNSRQITTLRRKRCNL